MKIRKFKKNDYSTILDIYSKSKLDELLYESKSFTFLPLDKDKKRLAEFQESEIYVYEDNGVMAYGAVFNSEIRAIFVHPNGRRKGIGRKLFKHLLSKIEGESSLYVAKSNMPAKKLYEQFGFSVVDEFETTYNGITVTANKMIRHTSA